MRKWIIFLLCTVLLLAACAKETTSTEPTDESRILELTPGDVIQSWNGMDFVEIPEGYYFCCEANIPGSVSSLICFLPRGESSYYPLCGKPNCRHADLDCNARINQEAFTYFNGALYSFEPFKKELIQMNFDGTAHQIVAYLDTENIPENYSLEYAFHHGKLLCFFRQENVPLEEQKQHLIALDLVDYSQCELAADYLSTVYVRPFSQFYQDKVYMTVLPIMDSDSNEDQFVEIDITNGETKTLIQGYLGGTYITDSTVYYLELGAQFLDRVYQKETGKENAHARFREYDRESGVTRSVESPVQDKELICAFYDEDCIYVNGELQSEENKETQTLYIFSRDYKLLDQICLENGLYFVAAASDRVFFTDKTGAPIKYYLDKSEIGSHKLTLHPLEAVGFPQEETH